MRLIDADKLNSVEKEIVLQKIRTPFAKDETAILRVFEFNEIRNAPTVDAVPVVHGYWTTEKSSLMLNCSVCNHGVIYDGRNDYRYCPHCGAKMDATMESKETNPYLGFPVTTIDQWDEVY